MSIKVEDKMTKFVVTISPRTTIREAWGTLSRIGFRHLPVVKNGQLVGIISDRDLLVYNPKDNKLSEAPIETCMTPSPITCSSNISVKEAARLMIANQIDCLPVISGIKLVGLLTTTDIVELVAEGHGPEEAGLPWTFTVEHITNEDSFTQ